MDTSHLASLKNYCSSTASLVHQRDEAKEEVMDKTTRDTMAVMIEREQRRVYARRIRAWEQMSGLTLVPMCLDMLQPRIDHLVDGLMREVEKR